jgi:hypothetical protein
LKTKKERPFSLREKDRMRGYNIGSYLLYPLSPTLSLRERGVWESSEQDYVFEYV